MSRRDFATPVRALTIWGAVFAVVAATFIAAPAQAASVDLVVNVTSDRGVYRASDTATYTLRVDNRGTEATSTAATVTLTVPNTQNSPVAWEQSVTCVPAGGAVCPTAFSRSGTTITATLPSMPVSSSLVFTVAAPGWALNYVRNAVAITATVAPGAADSDSQSATDTSSINVLIADPDIDYSTTATGPSAASAQTEITYDVVLTNSGETDSIYTAVELSAGAGSGTASSAPILDFAFTGLTCLNETGGASCANLLDIDGGVLAAFPVSPITASGQFAEIGVADMPRGSSVTLRFTVQTGRPACTTGAEANRLLTFTDTIDAIGQIGIPETSDLESDNVAIVLTNLPALPCTTGDVSTLSLVQPADQVTNGIPLGGAFEYTATYQNLSGDTAVDADIEFATYWPAAGGALLDGTPACTPSGSATCPTSWVLNGSSIRGIGAVLPQGGTLEITYTGVGGGDDETVCRPQSMGVNTRILPPLSFIDTNFVANNVYTTGQQTQGNNARRVITQTDVGSPCLDSHDDSVQQTGPFIDPEATIPLTGNAVPGQVLYFRTTITNQTPSPAYTSYYLAQTGAMPTSNGTLFDGNDGDRWFRHQSGDPAGLEFTDDYTIGGTLVTPFDTGVRCIEQTGGAVCPELISANGGTGGGGVLRMSAWAAYWKPGTQPPMPAGSSLSFISTYKIADLSPRYAESGCVPNTIAFGTGGGATTATVANLRMTALVGAATIPATFDRTSANDSTVTQIPIEIVRCTNTLSITKTALTPTMPLDRQVRYEIVVTNTSATALDLPRLIDGFNADAPATISCVSTTLNALCPTFTPRDDQRRYADGSTGPITFNGIVGPAQFDFVWGTAGAPTMPAGSSVTFQVTVHYPVTYSGNSSNIAYFLADQSATGGLWPTVNASASVSTPLGSALALRKSVNPVTPTPGSIVTFTVDVINTGATLPTATFTDQLNEVLVPTNATGYANFTCRPLVAGDNVLMPDSPVGTVACPEFTVAPGGIVGVITDFSTNSGLRLTYTAVAPLDSRSVPNIAQIVQNDSAVTRGDTSSQANFLTIVVEAVVEQVTKTLTATGSSSPIWGALLAILLLAFGVAITVVVRMRAATEG